MDDQQAPSSGIVPSRRMGHSGASDSTPSSSRDMRRGIIGGDAARLVAGRSRLRFAARVRGESGDETFNMSVRKFLKSLGSPPSVRSSLQSASGQARRVATTRRSTRRRPLRWPASRATWSSPERSRCPECAAGQRVAVRSRHAPAATSCSSGPGAPLLPHRRPHLTARGSPRGAPARPTLAHRWWAWARAGWRRRGDPRGIPAPVAGPEHACSAPDRRHDNAQARAPCRKVVALRFAAQFGVSMRVSHRGH